MDLVLIGILIFLGILLAVFVMFLFSKLKGKIEIEIPKTNFSSGEVVNGKLKLKLRNSLSAKKLQIGIIGMRKTTSYNNGKRSSRTMRVYEFYNQIDGEKTYPAGEKIYDFEFKIPEDAGSGGNKVLNSAIKSVQLLAGQHSRVKWYLVSNLDISGFDVSKKMRIYLG